MSKQRANNEMSVYYDPSGKGSWKAAVTVPGSGGRRKVRRGQTRAEAHEKGLELMGQIRSGTLTDGRMTVTQFAQQWMEENRLARLEPSTLRGYDLVLTAHALPAFGSLQLASLKTAHIQRRP